MPRKTIDYTKTSIYKITCKDTSVFFEHLDYTSNFRNRKNFHKAMTNGTRADIELYNIIRQNGGWDNWEMTEIEKINCKSKEEAIEKKKEYEKIKSNKNILESEFSMETENMTKLFLESVKENREFQKQMFDLLKDNIGGNNTINSNNKTMNNQFNLNLFLNETCKDAMNINEFIDYVTVNLDDFENFGKVGYPKALSEIIVRNLNELDIKIRPIHCSDLKREVLHVKHDGVWHSDDSQKFIKKSITYVANKNIRQRPLWQEENPESKNCLTTSFEYYNNICLASLGPATDEQEADFLKKITSSIAKQVVIDKKKKY